MQFSYDSDPKQAADTRVKLLDMIATNKTPVMSYHFNWPGFGNIAKTGDGFHYYPSGDGDEPLGDLRFRGRPFFGRPRRLAQLLSAGSIIGPKL